MRLRLRKLIPYVFLLSVVLLIYREIDRINKVDDHSRTWPESAEKQPLVAGVGIGQQRSARRSGGVVADDRDGGERKNGAGGAWGREPLWQENNNHLEQRDPDIKQREIKGEVDSKPSFDEQAKYNNVRKEGLKNRTRTISEILKAKNLTKEERPAVLSIAVNEPIVVGEPNPPLQIKDLSSLVAMKNVPAANFTIVVHNPREEPFQTKTEKQTELSDVFIGVKTTEKYHRDRLQIILDTWYSLAPEQTYFFTDVDDDAFQQKSNGHMINTQCQGTHSRLALCCKTSVMFNMFYKSNKRWLCHVDDDNYLNVPELMKLLRQYDHNQDYYLGRASLSHPIEAIDRDSNQKVSFWFATGGAGFCVSRALANKMAVYASSGTFERMCNRIRLPDDVTLGFIIEVLLKKPLTKVQGFNSHLQQLRSIKTSQLQHQITLSYSISDKRVNIINMPSSLYHIDQDPTRFKTFHCTYFRGFGNCPTR